jgi:DnaJ-class molecular chaperone
MKEVDKHHPDAYRVEEPCKKCRGTGESKYGNCPTCKGTGTDTSYVAPETIQEEARLDAIQDMHYQNSLV